MDTRDKILNATLNLLKDNSNFDEITLIKVAQAANIGKSTVYDYFNSKEELFEETSSYLLKQYENILFEEFKTTDFNSMFNQQIKRLIDVSKSARIIADTLFNYQNEFVKTIKSEKILTSINKFKEKIFGQFRFLFEKAYQEHLINNSKQNEYKKYVVSAIISGLIYQYTSNEIDINEDELIELIKKECLINLNN